LPHPALPAAVVFPDFSALTGAPKLASILGALMTVVLILSVLTLVVCAITWAIAGSHGSTHAATRAKTSLWIAVGTAALAGAGATWANFLLHLGTTL